jgi:hypothetical protein
MQYKTKADNIVVNLNLIWYLGFVYISWETVKIDFSVSLRP